MKLILAQGAEHTNPDRLHKIVKTIEVQASNLLSPMRTTTGQMIRGKYEPEFNVGQFIYDGVQYVAEEKFDGFSYLNDEGRFFSKRLSEKKGNEGQPIEKTGHMIHLSAMLKHIYDMCGPDFHGEVYIPGGISDDVTTILGCDEDKAVARQWSQPHFKKLHYMLIDLRKYKGQSLINEPYYVRRALLEHLYNKYIATSAAVSSFIHLAPILPPDPVSEFRRIVLSGGEGIIMKRTDALYVPDKKPANNWVKGKKKIYLDAIIMGYNDGTGKNAQLFGSFEFGLYVDGKLKKMGSTSSGLNDTTRNIVAANPDAHIGLVIEIEAIQESRNSFRNAVFIRLREDGDKNPKECTNTIENIKVKEDLLG